MRMLSQSVYSLIAGGDGIVTDLPWWAEDVVDSCNQPGTAEQRMKEGKHALNWTRFSCSHFMANQLWLQMLALAYKLANFLRRLALPHGVTHRSLTTLRENMFKIGAKSVYHARDVTFQMAQVAIPRQLPREILWRIGRLLRPPESLAPA